MIKDNEAATIQATNLFAIDGCVALITGGGTGIGLMMAKTLAENGAERVYIVGRREEKLKEAAALYPGTIIPLPGDLTCKESLENMSRIVRDDVGYLNLLICNAGMQGPGIEPLKPRHTLQDFVDLAWKSPMTDFDAVYGLNCSAVYYSVLAFLPLLEEGNNRQTYLKSQVIATASTAAFLRNPRAGFAYTSSKAALISMFKSFSTFCVPFSIRFNIIAAGLFPSALSEPMFKPFVIDKTKKLTQEGVFSRNYQPAERAGSEADMAGLTLYMASKAGEFLNGSVMVLDGGKLATMPATY